MIRSTDIEKAVDKKNLFMIKTFTKLGIQGDFFDQ